MFELEADSTIPSEYILLRHYLAEPVDSALEAKIANYLRRTQGNHGGWPLVQDGAFDMSASVKSYFALKMIGDSVDAPHMVRAREAIRSRGGAARVNVFTRFLLAFYGVLSWRAVPVLPVEIMLLPMWSPFHLNKISYWARTTIVPLMVMAALKPLAKNPKGVGIDELFLQDPKSVGMTPKAPHQSWGWFTLFSTLDKILRVVEPLFPKKLRQRAIDAALAFTEERLNGEDGMGAIYPPMANIVMMYDALGKGPDFPPRAVTRRGIDKLLVIGEHEAYCQPCVSPVWDTALTCHALAEAGGEDTLAKMKQGLDWLKPRQVLDLKGDWAVKAPDVRPGGWAFQYNNAHYPDLDDTAVVVMAMDRARRASGSKEYDQAISRGREWIEGLQSRDGGWAAFDVNNLEYYLNNIPFSDHGALLDPPTEDVTARCISMLAQLGETAETSKAVADGIAYLRRTQLAEGSWYGRWGLNYIYGTWSVLCALNAAGVDHQDPMMRKAVDWLVSIQNQRWRLGRGCRQLSAGLQGIRGRSVDFLANGMGLAWIDGGWRSRESGGGAGGGVPKSHTDRKRALGRGALHGYGLSAGVLFALSWLLEVLSALGAGAVPKFEKHQQQGGRGRDVTLGAGAAAIVDNSVDRNSNDPRPVLIVTGLVQEARIAAGPGMIVICSSSDPQQLRALLATLDPIHFQGCHLVRRCRRAGSVAEIGRRGGGDRGSGRRYPFSGRSGAERGIDRPCGVASPARGPRRPRRRGAGDCGDRLQGRAAFGDGRGSGRYGKPYCRSLCGQGRLAVRGAAGHLRSRQPGASGAGQERHQAERRHRPRQGAARAWRAIPPRCGRWSPRESISIARCAPCAAAAASCTAKRGSPPRRSDPRVGF